MPIKRNLIITSGCLCALFNIVWLSTLVANYSHRFTWGQNPSTSVDACVCDDGIVVGWRVDDPFDTDPEQRGDRHSLNAHGNDPHFFFLGAGWFHVPTYRVMIVPLWMLIALTLPAPALSAWRNAKRNRLLANTQCLECEYDLRAHQPGGRCPECGTFIDECAPYSFPVQLTAGV